MKKIMKSRIFIFILTSIIFTSILVYASTTYKASDVIYNASDGTSKNVNDALNELYAKKSTCDNKFCSSLKTGSAVFYNPVSGTKCDAGEAVTSSTTGTKTGCMKWYIYNYNNESSTVDMILDHNTTAGIAWNSNNKNVAYEDSLVKLEVDKLVSESKWKDIPRLIRAEEIVQITGKTDWTNTSAEFELDSVKENGKSKYAWLFDYTSICTGFGCNIADSSNEGYWTSTPYGEVGNCVWSVHSYNRAVCISAQDKRMGIRPVITILKSKLS